MRLPPTSGIFWRRGELGPRSARMGWIFFAGSGSSPRLGWPGIGRHGSRPATFAGGFRSPASSPGRTGAARARPPRGRHRWVRRMRRRCVRTPRRCRGPSMTSTWMRAAGRSWTRFRWIDLGGAGGCTRITIPWSRSATNAAGCTGPGCLTGTRAASQKVGSTRSSWGCRRTGTGRWGRAQGGGV